MNYTLQTSAVQLQYTACFGTFYQKEVFYAETQGSFSRQRPGKIEEIYHIKKEDITSFSANVNPLGISPLLKETLAKHVNAITSYPDRDYTGLRKSICQYTGHSLKISLWETALQN